MNIIAIITLALFAIAGLVQRVYVELTDRPSQPATRPERLEKVIGFINGGIQSGDFSGVDAFVSDVYVALTSVKVPYEEAETRAALIKVVDSIDFAVRSFKEQKSTEVMLQKIDDFFDAFDALTNLLTKGKVEEFEAESREFYADYTILDSTLDLYAQIPLLTYPLLQASTGFYARFITDYFAALEAFSKA